jgi:drug/metabolite transporter (DMT)-like permease
MSEAYTRNAAVRAHVLRKMAAIPGRRYIAPMQSSERSIGRATLLVALSALCFGSISVLTVLLTRAGIPLLTAMAWRYVLAAILLMVFARVDRLRSVPTSRTIQLLLIGGVGQALITYLSLHALEYIPVGPLAFLFYTYPAWVALIAAVRRTEKLTYVRIVALSLALIGVTVMVGAPQADKLNPIGVAFALASALLYSVYLPSLGYLQQGIPPMLSTLVLVTGAAISFTLVALFAGQLYLPKGGTVWPDIFTLALVSTVIAFSTLIAGLSVLGSVRTAIIATIEPFFTAILGVAVLGNQLTVATLAGGILIASAVTLIQWSSARVELRVQSQAADAAQSR